MLSLLTLFEGPVKYGELRRRYLSRLAPFADEAERRRAYKRADKGLADGLRGALERGTMRKVADGRYAVAALPLMRELVARYEAAQADLIRAIASRRYEDLPLPGMTPAVLRERADVDVEILVILGSRWGLLRQRLLDFIERVDGLHQRVPPDLTFDMHTSRRTGRESFDKLTADLREKTAPKRHP